MNLNRRDFLIYSTTSLSDILLPKKSHAKTIYVNNLVVNRSKRYHTICKKDEKSGIADLRKILTESPFEDFWAYIPKKKEWHELGKDEQIQISNEGFKSSLKIDYAKLNKIYKIEDEIIHWHIHVIISNYLKNQPMLTEYMKFILKNPIIEVFPSWNDISTIYGFKKRYHKQNPEGVSKFKICSRFGITQYDLRYNFSVYNELKNLEELVVSVIDLKNKDLRSYNSRTQKELLENHLEYLNSKHFKVSFKAHHGIIIN